MAEIVETVESQDIVFDTQLEDATRKMLSNAIELGASDIFLVAGLPLTFKIDNVKHKATEPLLPGDVDDCITDIYTLAKRDIETYTDSVMQDDDFSFAIPQVGRFRVNVFKQRGSNAAVIRPVAFGIPTPEELNIPDYIMDMADFRNGLVLVVGGACAGKSSTLACLVDRINHERDDHIITIEEPVEFLHRHAKGIVTQREVGVDIPSYEKAMRSAMRESPDVILIGEMRDTETMAAAMSAAETAQLVFSTMHTLNASSAIDRIIDSFPPNQQHQVRMQLASVLKAIIVQQLVPSVQGGLVPVFEVMLATPNIQELIRNEKTHQIDSAVSYDKEKGMRSMDSSLIELAKSGIITFDTAINNAIHRDTVKRNLSVGEVVI